MLQGNLSIPSEQTDLAPSSEIGAPYSSLSNAINTIQADLYFESAAGYGKWRILCSGIFRRDLARNGAQSEMALKILEYVSTTSSTQKSAYRFRELSSGCFSKNNQKPLTKDSPFEIYRARLPGSVRLVVCCCSYASYVDDPDNSSSIILTSTMSLEEMYV